MNFPQMTPVRQRFERPRVDDIEGTVRTELSRALECAQLRGKEVAVACGSRGIRNVALVARTVVGELRARGACPFVVPAMGSHGGATAEGQVGVLESLGITEVYCGAEIRSFMEVVPLGTTDSGIPIYMDRNAHAADGGVVLINRIKTHTDFKGDIESGLMKMAAIGLGKQAQALVLHRHGVHGIRDLMKDVGRHVLSSGKILCGVALLENAYDETAVIEALRSEEIPAREPALLTQSKQMMPSLPVEDIDVLIIDEIGKDKSGTGMDTNIIGRMRIPGEPEPESPRIRYIVVRDLSEATHGNATGIGLADLITRRCFDKIDLEVTYQNGATSTFLARSMIPMALDNDRRCLEEALRACWGVETEQARIVHISSTLELENIRVSEPLLPEVTRQPHLEITGPLESVVFDADGNMGSATPAAR
jgi:hypothetical protein